MITTSIEKVKAFNELLFPEQKFYLQENHTVVKFRKNQIVYQEREQPENLYCVVTGKIKIFKEGIGGRGQIVRMVGSDGFFGYRALFAEEPYVTSAISIEESIVVVIKKNILMEILSNNNALAKMFIKLLAVELGYSNQQTVSLTQKHIRGRLAEALLMLRDTYGLDEDGVSLGIYLSREDLANLSNMTTSNAIRTLSNFATEKMIIVDGRRIKLVDEEALRRISTLG